MLAMLYERLRVAVSLDDDALGLIFINIDVVLQRSDIFGPYDLPGFNRQALELLEFALMKFEPSDAQEFTRCLRLPQTSSLWTGNWCVSQNNPAS